MPLTIILKLKRTHPNWGARTPRAAAARRDPALELPSESTVQRILEREGLVKKRRHHRRLHPGCPKHVASEANDIWAVDYKGQFKLRNRQYCCLLGCEGLETISFERTKACFNLLFAKYGLPTRIRSDNVSARILDEQAAETL